MTAPRYVLEDPVLPHQIVITMQRAARRLTVSCNCLRRGLPGGMGGYRAIETRLKWEPGEAYACWLAHMREIGADVA